MCSLLAQPPPSLSLSLFSASSLTTPAVPLTCRRPTTPNPRFPRPSLSLPTVGCLCTPILCARSHYRVAATPKMPPWKGPWHRSKLCEEIFRERTRKLLSLSLSPFVHQPFIPSHPRCLFPSLIYACILFEVTDKNGQLFVTFIVQVSSLPFRVTSIRRILRSFFD